MTKGFLKELKLQDKFITIPSDDENSGKAIMLCDLLDIYKKQLILNGVIQQRKQVCTLHSNCQYQSGFNECSYLLQCDYKH